MKIIKNQSASGLEVKKSLLVTVKSGLEVDVYDDLWVILPNKGKGWAISVEWLHSSVMAEEDRELILEVFIHLVRNNAASTAATVIINVKPVLMSGIPSLISIKGTWSGLKTGTKKSINQFFGALSNLGEYRFTELHGYTRTHLDKGRSNVFDSSKGAYSDVEFDSLGKQINANARELDWADDRGLSFYQSGNLYGSVRNKVTSKLLLFIVRRPIQLAILKWSDLIPSGSSFNDSRIRTVDEVGTVGASTLQLRVFLVKSSGLPTIRSCPERYPIHLSEDLSSILIRYKQLTIKGLSLLMCSLGIKLAQSQLLKIMDDMPMFPDVSLFGITCSNLEVFKKLFTTTSIAFHISEASITMALKAVQAHSDRSGRCSGGSNRIRHTVLTRGAKEGLPAVHLAKITGVTVPAARYYIDLDYGARSQIDSKYIGNEFLKKIFSGALILSLKDDEQIFDSQFNPVGASANRKSCLTCSTVMGRPLGCYGCPNFRALLDGDHSLVLAEAEDKLAINRCSLINPLFSRSVEKLERQISWVKITIVVCNEILERQGAIDG